jgi:hypothetical protein
MDHSGRLCALWDRYGMAFPALELVSLTPSWDYQLHETISVYPKPSLQMPGIRLPSLTGSPSGCSSPMPMRGCLGPCARRGIAGLIWETGDPEYFAAASLRGVTVMAPGEGLGVDRHPGNC